MARDLNLKLEWVSADAARVSWNDAYPIWNNRVATVALSKHSSVSHGDMAAMDRACRICSLVSWKLESYG